MFTSASRLDKRQIGIRGVVLSRLFVFWAKAATTMSQIHVCLGKSNARAPVRGLGPLQTMDCRKGTIRDRGCRRRHGVEKAFLRTSYTLHSRPHREPTPMTPLARTGQRVLGWHKCGALSSDLCREHSRLLHRCRALMHRPFGRDIRVLAPGSEIGGVLARV
jgi:hypothetical protein